MPESRRHFRGRVDAALENPRLQQALTEAMTSLRAVRARGFESYDFEAGREDLKRRRQANLPMLPELVEQFAKTDPYVIHGVVDRWYIREWTTVTGHNATNPVHPSK